MALVKFKGTDVRIEGRFPSVGSLAPSFRLTGVDLKDIALESFGNKVKIINIVPSLDTSVCALSAVRFNTEIARMQNSVLVNISADLPFAQKRFCEANALKNIVTLSTMRSPNFGRDYGVLIADGPLAGLMSRAVLVLDKANRVVHAELVPDIAHEPDYAAALAAART